MFFEFKIYPSGGKPETVVLSGDTQSEAESEMRVRSIMCGGVAFELVGTIGKAVA